MRRDAFDEIDCGVEGSKGSGAKVTGDQRDIATDALQRVYQRGCELRVGVDMQITSLQYPQTGQSVRTGRQLKRIFLQPNARRVALPEPTHATHPQADATYRSN